MTNIELVRGSSKNAVYEDYVDFFIKVLTEPRRCVLTKELFAFDTALSQWYPALSRSSINILKSYASDTGGFIQPGRIEPHLYRFSQSLAPSSLIDLPEWDGNDYVKEMAYALNCSNVSKEVTHDLIRDWGCNLWRRFDNSSHQNRVLLLRSNKQGIGKDFWCNALIGGLEQYSQHMSLDSKENELYLKLSQALVIKITEFARLNKKFDIASWKDIVTRESASVRPPYGKLTEKRNIRCSFISTCNVETGFILKDPTGNRRYIILDLDDIEWNYPTNQSLQILSQFKVLAEQGFQIPSKSNQAMRDYLVTKTPKDANLEALHLWDQRLSQLELSRPECAGIFTLSDVTPVLQEVEKEYGVNTQTFQALLNKTGRTKRVSAGQRYRRGK